MNALGEKSTNCCQYSPEASAVRTTLDGLIEAMADEAEQTDETRQQEPWLLSPWQA
jgi:hypothetical protein